LLFYDVRCSFFLLDWFMPVNQQQSRDVFQKLGRQLTKAAKKTSPENVHKLRTNSRRVETVLDRLVPAPDRSTKNLVKVLSKLRKKAGKVRDLDVQTAALRGLKISPSAQKTQLLRSLCSKREQREKKLSKSLDKQTVRDLGQRLKRAARRIEIPEGMEPLSAALQEFAKLGQDRAPLSAEKLHQYRITGKQARYVAEMAERNPEAEPVIDQLKRMQDVIGDWHDWLTLTERAEKLFGGVKSSPLVAAMRNLTRAKFRQGVDAVAEAKNALAGEKIGLIPASRKSSRKTPAQTASRAAAA
jgi:CHAD domain-containing protein